MYFSGQKSWFSPEFAILQNIYWHLECCNDDMYDYVSTEAAKSFNYMRFTN